MWCVISWYTVNYWAISSKRLQHNFKLSEIYFIIIIIKKGCTCKKKTVPASYVMIVLIIWPIYDLFALCFTEYYLSSLLYLDRPKTNITGASLNYAATFNYLMLNIFQYIRGSHTTCMCFVSLTQFCCFEIFLQIYF